MKSQPKNSFAKYRKGRLVKNNRVFSGSCFFLCGEISSEIRMREEGGEAGGRNINSKRLPLFFLCTPCQRTVKKIAHTAQSTVMAIHVYLSIKKCCT